MGKYSIYIGDTRTSCEKSHKIFLSSHFSATGHSLYAEGCDFTAHFAAFQ